MVGGISISLFDFQEKAVLKLIDLVADERSKQTIIMKSPTGSGKTIILIDFIEEYLSKVDSNTAFIWLCPGKGDLEEQSRKKMAKYNSQRNTQNLFDALQGGFPAESTTFINWELVTKTGNTALREGERKNLFDRIAESHRANTTFIVIIDEEHSNNTAKAKAIIDAFSAKNIIRVSATAVENKRFEYFEIDEVDVINAGLITKALYVN
ncbi:MAG: DEAD/DEAH box helicase family protein, partial [Roseburia sp.]|nr:DEAD/DEAH box helicase family protein [Roseburia sp.]